MNPEPDSRIRPYFLDDDPVIYPEDDRVTFYQSIPERKYFSPAFEMTGAWLKAMMVAGIICLVILDKTNQPWNSAFDIFDFDPFLRLQMVFILCAVGGIITFIPFIIILIFALLEKPLATLIAFMLCNAAIWGYFYFFTESDTGIKVMVSVFAISSHLYFCLFYHRWLTNLERNAS